MFKSARELVAGDVIVFNGSPEMILSRQLLDGTNGAEPFMILSTDRKLAVAIELRLANNRTSRFHPSDTVKVVERQVFTLDS